MIAKCIAVLAVVAQINASGCTCGLSSVILPTSGSNSMSSPAVFVSGFGDSGTVTRNLVGQGKFPVALKNCGQIPDQQIQMTASRLTTPLQEKPTIRLPANIPAPTTISHTCTCYKTIVRPRVHHQIITVPSLQRYVETIHKPVVENIQYEALPVNCGSGVQMVQVGSGGSSSLLSLGSGAQAVEIPSIQLPQIQSQTIQVAQPCSCQC